MGAKKVILSKVKIPLRGLSDKTGMKTGNGKQHISAGLRRFLKEKIQTVLRLEILLLLHDHQPETFTAAEVADRLGFETDTTAHELEALESLGVVVQSDRGEKIKYRYLAVNATLATMVRQLALRYSRQRVSILSVILAEDPDRARRFTEAFKIIRRND
jgi:Fe2+ or Zn2+ uptake regulation protein